MKSIILFDVDGTVTNFERIDNIAVSKCFKTSKIVMWLDKLLWCINRLDLIANNFPLFKFRIWIYSLLSFSNYKANLKVYETVYVEETKKEIAKYYASQHERLKRLNMEIRFLSNNQLDTSTSSYIITVKNKGKYVMKNICGKYDIVFVVGNNWSDDVRLGLKLRKKNKTTRPVYIGKSKVLIKFLLKKKQVEVYPTLDEFVTHLTERKE